jgi:hypothetical protein
MTDPSQLGNFLYSEQDWRVAVANREIVLATTAATQLR